MARATHVTIVSQRRVFKNNLPSLVCNVISIELKNTYENIKGVTPREKSIWQTFTSPLSPLLGLAATRL